jgi:hypothetical protein
VPTIVKQPGLAEGQPRHHRPIRFFFFTIDRVGLSAAGTGQPAPDFQTES